MKRLLMIMLVVVMLVSIVTTGFAAKKYTIVCIGDQGDQFMKTLVAGMKATAEKNGADLLIGDNTNQLTKEVELVNTYTTQRIDAICITPLDANASVPALQEAHDAGIKIICFNDSLNADFPVTTLYISQTDLGTNSGKAAADYLKNTLKSKKAIKVAILDFKTQSPSQSDARENGFIDQIKKDSRVQIVAQQAAWTVDTAVPLASDILTINKDLDIAFGCNDGATKGWVLAAKESKRKLAVFGIDIDQEEADMLLSKDNILQAVCAQDPFEMGNMSIDCAVKALNGQSVDKNMIVPGKLFSRSSKTLRSDLDTFLNLTE